MTSRRAGTDQLPHVPAQGHVDARDGSSRNRRSGSCASALAIITRRFIPPDSVHDLGVPFIPQRQVAQQFLDIGAVPRSSRTAGCEKVTVASTLSNASVDNSCGTSPMRATRLLANRSSVVVPVDGDAAGRAARRCRTRRRSASSCPRRWAPAARRSRPSGYRGPPPPARSVPLA